eukprot:2108293-Alexandrium_andersonii.AAC.1
MSASLVGSEMCIRDRHRSKRSELELRSPESDLKFHPRRARPGDPASFCTCLLYTSDAADDM